MEEQNDVESSGVARHGPPSEQNYLLDHHDSDDDDDDDDDDYNAHNHTVVTLNAIHAQFIALDKRVSELENEKEILQNRMNSLEKKNLELEKKNSDLKQLTTEAVQKAEISIENSQIIPVWSMTSHDQASRGHNSNNLTRSIIRVQDSTTKMSEDTFTLLKVKRIFSQSWWFGTFVFFLQLVLLLMVFTNQCASWRGSTPFDVPFRVHLPSRIVQFLAILITVATSKDVIIPIKEISTLWFKNRVEWCKVVNIPIDETNFGMWILYILIPNVQQILEGALVVVIQFVFIIQSDDMIELFKDFAAIQIVSELDNAAFWLANHGYLGSQLKDDSSDAKKVTITDLVPPTFLGIPLRPVLLSAIFIILIGVFMPIVIGQNNGDFFFAKYPACPISRSKIDLFGNGVCNGGILNTYDCDFDGGDCINFNIAFPNCKAVNPADIENGICNTEYNNTACGFDGGDCCPLDKDDPLLGDGFCHSGHYSAAYCNYDNGDCDDMRVANPQCDFSTYSMVNENGEPFVIGNGTCDVIPEYMNVKCNWVFGDCIHHNETYASLRFDYPNCPKSFNLLNIGNGQCGGEPSLFKKCGYDGLDCCLGDQTKVKDGKCDADNPVLLSKECAWDGFDCCDTSEADDVSRLGDGKCHSEFNNKLCGWDGNDCDEFNEKYPDCDADKPYWLGDGSCDFQYNTEECGFDGGDCIK